MTADRKRLVWILILIGLFFANLIVAAVLVFNRITAPPKPVTPEATSTLPAP